MSSISSSFAQNRSRSLVALAGASFVPDATLAGLLVTAAASQVGSVAVIPTVTAFKTFSALTGLVSLTEGESLSDLGAQTDVLIAGDYSAVLKLRRVKRSVGALTAGNPLDNTATGYVVVENNVSLASGVNAASKVLVSRS